MGNNGDIKHTTTAIIPALNEEISIGSIVIKTKKYVNRVIVIDDGSTDCTAEIAQSAGAEVIKHRKSGYSWNESRPLYYFTIPGMIFGTIGLGMGLFSLERFYRGDSLSFGSTLLMILLTLIGTFMSFTGIILYSLSRIINKNK